MPKLIDADKLKEHYAWWDNEDKKIFDTIVDLQPTVDAEPVVHAHWIDENLDGYKYWKSTCSNCGWYGYSNYDSYVDVYDFAYCPYCGARMDEEGEDAKTN